MLVKCICIALDLSPAPVNKSYTQAFSQRASEAYIDPDLQTHRLTLILYLALRLCPPDGKEKLTAPQKEMLRNHDSPNLVEHD